MDERTSEICKRIWRSFGNIGSDIRDRYDYCAVAPVIGDEKQNYSIKQWLYKASDCVKYMKEHFPVKYVSSGYGRIFFKFDDSMIAAEVDRYLVDRKEKYLAMINAIDLTPYEPSQKVLNKLTGYFNKGSKVNCGAIKDVTKLLTYYYAAHLLNWQDLISWVHEAGFGNWGWKDDNGAEYSKIKEAIEMRVKPTTSLTRNRDEERLLNFSKKIWQAVKKTKLDFSFRTVNATWDECWKDKKNGCAYTIAYLLRVGETTVRFSDVTNEGGGTYGYQLRPCGYLMNKGDLETRVLSDLGLA